MKNKKFLIEEISRMRSMMGLNENFTPKLLLESVTPQRLKQLMSEFIGASDNASRRSIINNLTTDEKKIFNDYLSDPTVSQYFGGIRTIDDFVQASVGNELMKLTKLIATNSNDFAKKAGKNINFASSIDNLAKIEKELDNLKPSIASLANDIDPTTDYGKLITNITNKEYSEIDTNVYNDFYNYLDDLKTKTTDPDVQAYLSGVQTDMISIADEIDQVAEAKKLSDITGTDNIVGDNGHYMDTNYNIVDERGNLIDDRAFMKNQFDELNPTTTKTPEELELEAKQAELETKMELERDIKEIDNFIKGTGDYKGLQDWYKFWPSEYQKNIQAAFKKACDDVRNGKITITELQKQAEDLLKKEKTKLQLDKTNKKLSNVNNNTTWIEKHLQGNPTLKKLYIAVGVIALITSGLGASWLMGAWDNNVAVIDLAEVNRCFKTVNGWDGLDDDVKQKFISLGYGCGNRNMDAAPDKFISSVKYLPADPTSGSGEKFEIVINGETKTVLASGASSKKSSSSTSTSTSTGSITTNDDMLALMKTAYGTQMGNLTVTDTKFVGYGKDASGKEDKNIEIYSVTTSNGTTEQETYNVKTKKLQ